LRKEIRFVGTGGQGVVWAATLLGAAASKQKGLVVSVSAKYGAEVRGGISRADIVISDEREPFPWATGLDLLVVLDPRSVAGPRTSPLKRNALVLSTTALQNLEKAQVRVVLARERSKEELGSDRYANSIMVGYVAAILGVPDLELLRKAVVERSTEASKDFNLRAIEIGSQMAKAH
jgi:2-oxoglutarate ferredoxin oxidoreductase subunit gamma